LLTVSFEIKKDLDISSMENAHNVFNARAI